MPARPCPHARTACILDHRRRGAASAGPGGVCAEPRAALSMEPLRLPLPMMAGSSISVRRRRGVAPARQANAHGRAKFTRLPPLPRRWILRPTHPADPHVRRLGQKHGCHDHHPARTGRSLLRASGARQRLDAAPGRRWQARWADHAGAAARTTRLPAECRQGQPRHRASHDRGYDLPHLLDDQAAHLDRDHDAVRGGSLPTRRSDHALPAVLQGHARFRRRHARQVGHACRPNATSPSAIC